MITKEALNQMVGSQVMVQLKHGVIMVHGQSGVPEPLVAGAEGKPKQMVIVPFLCGTLSECCGSYLVTYVDSTSGRTVEMILSDDELVSVARLAAERLITPASRL
jgi:hypothetical protein